MDLTPGPEPEPDSLSKAIGEALATTYRAGYQSGREDAVKAIEALHRPVVLRKGGGADYYVTATVCMTCGGSDAWFDDDTPAPGAARYPCPTLRIAQAGQHPRTPGEDVTP